MDEIKKVLVVDHVESTRIFMRYILNNAGYRTLIAASATKALNQIDDEHFDIIITDIQLPDMDGFDFIKEVRNIEDDPSLPILVASMDNSVKAKEQGQLVGVTEWFAKPVSPPKLISFMKTLKSADD